MTIDEHREPDDDSGDQSPRNGEFEPRDTNHPTGSEQAAENEASDPPG